MNLPFGQTNKTSLPYIVKQISIQELDKFQQLLDCFEQVFAEPQNYGKDKRPDKNYIKSLLNDQSFIALVALDNEKLIGGLAAYELRKFEQARSEIYIYDLSIYEEYRKQGVATSLINYLKPIAKERGAWTIMVQADLNDTAPVNLYTKLGKREDIHHFNISIDE